MNGEQLKIGSDLWDEYEKEKTEVSEDRYEDVIRELAERLGV